MMNSEEKKDIITVIEKPSWTELGDILQQSNSMAKSLLPHLPDLLPGLVGGIVFQDGVKFR